MNKPVICPKCRAKNNPGASFCKNCGAALPDDGGKESVAAPRPVSAPKRVPGKSMKKPLLIAGCIVLSLLLIGGGAFAVKKVLDGDKLTEIDLVADIGISDLGISGYNGEAAPNIDNEKLRDKIDYSGDDEKVENFIDSVTYEVTPGSGLDNGRKVTLKAIYKTANAREAGVKVIKENKAFTVKGLEDKPEEAPVVDESDDIDEDIEEDEEESGADTMVKVVDTTDAPTNDGFAQVRSSRDFNSETNKVGKLSSGTEVVLYAKSYTGTGTEAWWKIAEGPYKGYYVHSSSFVDPGF